MSDYAYLSPDALVGPRDAISVVAWERWEVGGDSYGRYELTGAREGVRGAFYGQVWRSLVEAFQLPDAEEAHQALFMSLHPGAPRPWRVQSLEPDPELPAPSWLDPIDAGVWRTMLETRGRLLQVVNMHAGLIEGDPWDPFGRRAKAERPADGVRDWWEHHGRPELTRGVARTHDAICALLNWPAEACLRIGELRESHGYPMLTEDDLEHWVP